MCLVRSIVHDKTFTIDACKEDTEEIEFANTGDWSFYEGHYYSNKSPGLSFMAVLPYAIAQYCLQYVLPGDHESMFSSVPILHCVHNSFSFCLFVPPHLACV